MLKVSAHQMQFASSRASKAYVSSVRRNERGQTSSRQ